MQGFGHVLLGGSGLCPGTVHDGGKPGGIDLSIVAAQRAGDGERSPTTAGSVSYTPWLMSCDLGTDESCHALVVPHLGVVPRDSGQFEQQPPTRAVSAGICHQLRQLTLPTTQVVRCPLQQPDQQFGVVRSAVAGEVRHGDAHGLGQCVQPVGARGGPDRVCQVQGVGEVAFGERVRDPRSFGCLTHQREVQTGAVVCDDDISTGNVCGELRPGPVGFHAFVEEPLPYGSVPDLVLAARRPHEALPARGLGFPLPVRAEPPGRDLVHMPLQIRLGGHRSYDALQVDRDGPQPLPCVSRQLCATALLCVPCSGREEPSVCFVQQPCGDRLRDELCQPRFRQSRVPAPRHCGDVGPRDAFRRFPHQLDDLPDRSRNACFPTHGILLRRAGLPTSQTVITAGYACSLIDGKALAIFPGNDGIW